jgi:hypothetical protein
MQNTLVQTRKGRQRLPEGKSPILKKEKEKENKGIQELTYYLIG